MSRGFGARESSFSSSFNKTGGANRKSTFPVGTNRRVMEDALASREEKSPLDVRFEAVEKEIKSFPSVASQRFAKEFYVRELEGANKDLGYYEKTLKAAKDAYNKPGFDWSDANEAAWVVPLSAEASDRYDGDAAAYLKDAWAEYYAESDAVGDAETKDREYEEDEGRPASEAGLSEVARIKGEFFKDLVGRLIDDRVKNKEGWAKRTEVKYIFDRYREKNKS